MAEGCSNRATPTTMATLQAIPRADNDFPGHGVGGDGSRPSVHGAAVPPAGRRACSLAHKCAEHPLQAQLVVGQVVSCLEFSEGVLRLRAKMGKPEGIKEPKPVRGIIRAWSMPSRLRAYRAISALPWPGLGGSEVFFLTLTYPGEWSRDGRVWQQHLRAFVRWLRSEGLVWGVWKREHQRRGAPHFHLWCVCPYWTLDERPQWWLRSFRDRVSRKWFEVVGSGDEAHLRAGTQVHLLPPGQSAVGYFKAYVCKPDEGKEYQHQLPDDVHRPGRWWGHWGQDDGFKASWRPQAVDHFDFIRMKRTLRRYKRSRGRRIMAEVRAAAAERGERVQVRRPKIKLPRRWLTQALGTSHFVGDSPWQVDRIVRDLLRMREFP